MKINKRKPAAAFLLMAVLLAALSFVLVRIASESLEEKAQKTNAQKLAGLTQRFREMEIEISDLIDLWFQKNNTAAEMMSAALRTLTDGSVYNGPEVFDDGVVIRVEDGRIIYPEAFSGSMEGLIPGEPWDEAVPGILHLSPGDEGTEVYFTVRPIVGDYYYADWTTVEEYNEDIDLGNRRMNSLINDMENSYDVYFLIVSLTDGKLLYASDALENFDEGETLQDLGLTRDDFEKENPTVRIGGKPYLAFYRQTRLMGTPANVLILMDDSSEAKEIIRIGLGMALMIGFFTIGLVLWQYWVQRYAAEHSLSITQYSQYHPRKVRRVTAAAALLGTLCFFIFSLFFQSLRNLNSEAAANGKNIGIIADYLNRTSQEKTLYQIDEKVWTAYYAERIAGLMEADPRLRSQEVLSAINGAIGSEFIMLFDENGDEIVSSNSYAGFRLGREGSETSADFLRLLLGVDTIILEPEPDPTTEKTLQQTGSRVDLGTAKFGALIVSFDSEKSRKAEFRNHTGDFIKSITSPGKLSVITENETGRVLFASDPDVAGNTVSGAGLDTDGRGSSEMDIFTINGTRYLGPFYTDENFTYYYLTREDQIQGISVIFSAVLGAGFLVISLLVSLVMLGSYTTEAYEASVTVRSESPEDYIPDLEKVLHMTENTESRPGNFRKWWGCLLPEQRARIYLQVFAGVMLILLGTMMILQNAGGAGSAIEFVLFGNWKRGFNLIAGSAIFLLIMAYLIYLFIKGFLEMLFYMFLDRREKTIFRLVTSLLQYCAFIGVFFATMEYLGINTTVMLAGFSALSLAVSLGGKDLVADILAGIFIIFEDDFHVGDFIEVNNFSGIVQEIGVRSTKILGLGDNIKIIGNQEVNNVLNKSKLNTWYTLEFNIRIDQPLSMIEDLLKRELPEIGSKIPEIISGPVYKGVWQINSSAYTLAVTCECRESDSRIVRRDLNRELILLFERNGYKFG